MVVYGYEQLRDLSLRAAARLEQLGFGWVCDYVPGKVDWFAGGLPPGGCGRPHGLRSG